MKKICKRCGVELEISQFAKNKNTKDGYEGKCKECRKAQRKEFHTYSCKQCGNTFSATKKQDFCSNDCSGEFKRNEPKDFDDFFINNLPDYTLLTKYTKSNEKVTIRHDTCEKVFSATPNNIISKNSRCPFCFGNNVKKDTTQFKEEVYNIVGDEYVVLGSYVTNKTKLDIKHNICGYVYKVNPDKFLRGRRCPNCKASHGESAIRDYLEKHKISYEREFRFEDCRYIRSLPFDFVVLHTDQVKLAIEFDGEQHFIEKEFYGGREYLEKVKERDAIKTEYCRKNDIPLLRIPYYKFDNINDILNDFIRNLDLCTS